MLHEHSGTFPVFVPPASRRFPFLTRYIGLISQICLCTGAAVVVGSVLYASWPDWSAQLGFESKPDAAESASVVVSKMESVPIYDLKLATAAGRGFFLDALGRVGCLDFKDGGEFQPNLSWIDLGSDCDMFALSPAQDCLAFSTFDGQVRLQFLDHPERNLVLRRPRNIPINAMVFSPDGKILAAGDSTGRVYTWSVETGKPLSTFPRESGSVSSLCFTSAEQLLVGVGNRVETWKLSSRSHLPAKKTDSDIVLADICRDVYLTPNGRNLIVTDFSGTVSCWNCADRQRVWASRPSSYICRAIAFSQSGDRFLASHENNTIQLVDLATGKVLAEFEAEMKMVTAAILDDSHDLMYTASADGRIRIWSLSGEYVLSAIQPEHG